MNKKVVVISLFLFSFFNPAFAEEIIPISKTWSMGEMIFDGKWSHWKEWKNSTEEKIEYGSILRIAHQGDFILILIEMLSDRTYNRVSDRAIVCFDSNNQKSIIPEKDDYCFIASSGRTSGIILQGGSNIPRINYFETIQNTFGFIGRGAMSDDNDRYSKTPHETYEFKIPLELLQRSDNYGFYLRVYDNDKVVSQWPTDIEVDLHKIPSPNLWGTIVSPDKSLPEFGWPIISMGIIFSSIIVMMRLWKLQIV